VQSWQLEQPFQLVDGSVLMVWRQTWR